MLSKLLVFSKKETELDNEPSNPPLNDHGQVAGADKSNTGNKDAPPPPPPGKSRLAKSLWELGLNIDESACIKFIHILTEHKVKQCIDYYKLMIKLLIIQPSSHQSSKSF